jgi:hypothetical protein
MKIYACRKYVIFEERVRIVLVLCILLLAVLFSVYLIGNALIIIPLLIAFLMVIGLYESARRLKKMDEYYDYCKTTNYIIDNGDSIDFTSKGRQTKIDKSTISEISSSDCVIRIKFKGLSFDRKLNMGLIDETEICQFIEHTKNGLTSR